MKWILFFLVFPLFALEKSDRYVRLNFRGQLGNQLFQAAAAYAVAKDHHLDLIIDETLIRNNPRDSQQNIDEIFLRLPLKRPSKGTNIIVDESTFIDFHSPYNERMKIQGFFESPRYFEPYIEEIKAYFYPTQEKIDYVRSRYHELFEKPLLVSLHIRTFFQDFKKNQSQYQGFQVATCFPDIEFYKKAIEYFPKEAIFVVTSDYIPWAKQFLKQIDRTFIFIEGENHLIDFCIHTQCHHNIFSSSTFAWWGAYLNKNPDKMVITRNWWYPHNKVLDGFFPENWTIIYHEYNPPCPDYSNIEGSL